MEKIDVVKHILRCSNHGSFVNDNGGFAWAPTNIALCKYWGKRDVELNLPQTSSLSLSLTGKGTVTTIKHWANCDQYVLNGEIVDSTHQFAKRLHGYLNLFRLPGVNYQVTTDSNIPVAAGVASSACGFAALIQALNNLYDWRLAKKDLSILARLGSGSACRSLWHGFVEWQRGEDLNGLDSHGVPLDFVWPELRVGILLISTQEKCVGSSAAMQISVNTSPLYSEWPQQVERDLATLEQALQNKDFRLLGATMENNTMAMHQLAGSGTPAITYLSDASVAAIEKIMILRDQGIAVYFTADAGPNLQLFFLAEAIPDILQVFPSLDIVTPFPDPKGEQLILVDEKDNDIGMAEKNLVHMQALLHRAFSVFILRKYQNRMQVLLQQRSAEKYHSANLWSNTCCGHPRPGEDIIPAAKRRLEEEMGFSTDLREVGMFHYLASFPPVALYENEIDHVLVGFTDKEDFNFNPNEVQNCAWIDLDFLRQDVVVNPGKYTIWLPEALFFCYGAFSK